MKAKLCNLFAVALMFCLCPPVHADGPLVSRVFSNGLRLLLRERHTLPFVAVDLWVRAGSREERREEFGAAHFLEHALFKGTTTRGPGEVDAAMEDLGASLDAATGPDFVHFYTTVPAARLPEALSVLADALQRATLPEAEVNRERGIILDELGTRDQDPNERLIDRLYAVAYPASPYRHSPGGTLDTILARRRSELAAFYHRCYAPDRSILVLAGDCSTEEAVSAATRAFGSWRSYTQPSPSNEEVKAFDFTPAFQEIEAASGERDGVAIGFPAPAAGEVQAACAAQVAAALLGRSGRLSSAAWQRTQADVKYTPRQDPSLFLLTAQMPADTLSTSFTSARSLAAALLDQVRGLQTSPPTEAEFERARRAVLGRLLYDVETDAGLARTLGYAAIVGGDGPRAMKSRLETLTLNDLMHFVQTYLDPNRCAQVIRQSRASIGSR